MATRRGFIQKSALGAAGLTLIAKSYSRISGANDRIHAGIDGFSDPMTNAYMRNWMECVCNRKKPKADITAGYNHSIVNIMWIAALRTGEKVTFDEARQEVPECGKRFSISYLSSY
jgi:hypothetical protein